MLPEPGPEGRPLHEGLLVDGVAEQIVRDDDPIMVPRVLDLVGIIIILRRRAEQDAAPLEALQVDDVVRHLCRSATTELLLRGDLPGVQQVVGEEKARARPGTAFPGSRGRSRRRDS